MTFASDLQRLDRLAEILGPPSCICDRSRPDKGRGRKLDLEVVIYGNGPTMTPPPADGIIRIQACVCPVHGPRPVYVSNFTPYRVEVIE